jgi:hypothetical protein
MSVKPRVVFMRFAARGTSKLELWQTHRDRVLGFSASIVETFGQTTDGSVVAYNLVSTNNRVLARSAHLYAHLGDAIAAAHTLVESAAALKIALVTDSLRGQYGWHGSAAGVAVLTSDHWHATERDRRASVEVSLIALATAEIATEARLIDTSLTGRS